MTLDLNKRATCGCGWRGKEWFVYSNAEAELLDHARKDHGLDLRVEHISEVATSDAERTPSVVANGPDVDTARESRR